MVALGLPFSNIVVVSMMSIGFIRLKVNMSLMFSSNVMQLQFIKFPILRKFASHVLVPILPLFGM